MTPRLCTFVFIFLLSACASQRYNTSIVPYEHHDALVQAATPMEVIIADTNLGKPSRRQFDVGTPILDESLEQYLTSNAIKVHSSRHWQQSWRESLTVYGESSDTSSGYFNQDKHQQRVAYSLKAVCADTPANLVLFTDLIVRNTYPDPSGDHGLKFDGVSRKMTYKGTGDGVSTDFNWNQGIDALSLWITVFNCQGQLVHSGIGGIEPAQALLLKGKGRYVRRKNSLENITFMMDGIKLALHPLVKLENYPADN